MQNYVTLQCPDCKEKNYTVIRNKKNNKEKLNIKKYCPRCKKHTVHKEIK